jgi:hypothetical protein
VCLDSRASLLVALEKLTAKDFLLVVGEEALKTYTCNCLESFFNPMKDIQTVASPCLVCAEELQSFTEVGVNLFFLFAMLVILCICHTCLYNLQGH